MTRVSGLLRPPKRRTAAEWADKNRKLPQGSAERGEFRSSRAPWFIQIAAYAANPLVRRITMVMATQLSKSETLLNIAGQRLDDDPVPMIYVGPTKSNIEGVMEPRIQKMLDSTASLSAKTLKGKRPHKMLKRVAGVELRLAWAGSKTEVAAQPAGLGLVDEVDLMDEPPVESVQARLATYPDHLLVLASSPTVGNVETYTHAETGMEHWKVGEPDDVRSPIWQYWQEGTRHEWAVPCQHCAEYFVPRFKLLSWPTNSTAAQARKSAGLACPHCGALHEERHKEAMNAAGLFIAPGQWVENGVVCGDPPESDSASFWVSGLMSPWVTFGARAAEWITAANSGKRDRIERVVNQAFGELFRSKGEAPPWQDVERCGTESPSSYARGEFPTSVQRVLISVDVQKDRFVVVKRGWGYASESWLLDYAELEGKTDEPEVWDKLTEYVEEDTHGTATHAVAIDSGYRTEQVYDWWRERKALVYVVKGIDRPHMKPYSMSEIEVRKDGKKQPYGVKLWIVNSANFKQWVHDRVERAKDKPGAWHLPRDVDEDYCRQIVAEQLMTFTSGRKKWVKVASDNHYLDCEMMQAFLADVTRVRSLPHPGDARAAKTAIIPPAQQRRMRSPGVQI